ncbi:MAG: malate synthase A, partial [Actinomycetota bacterium]
MANEQGIDLRGAVKDRFDEVLTTDALEFVATLHREFDSTREELLHRRSEQQAKRDAGDTPSFMPETEEIRAGEWKVEPAPEDLRDRRVEITGPTDRKMMINALNSGAKGFMVDFEDSNSPTWDNLVGGQVNLIDAIEGTIEFAGDDKYRLNDDIATL